MLYERLRRVVSYYLFRYEEPTLASAAWLFRG
jgi:hypothetical protein